MRSLRLLLTALLLTGCARTADPPQDVESSAMTRKTRIYLISAEDSQGCGDRTSPLEVELAAPEPAIWGALHGLLAAGGRYRGSGLYNALAVSPLQIERIDRQGSTARVYLTGYVELGRECDGPRLLAQLTRTAVQFPDVKKAELFLDGKPLRDLLSSKK